MNDEFEKINLDKELIAAFADEPVILNLVMQHGYIQQDLKTLWQHHPDTAMHGVRTAKLAIKLSPLLQLNEDDSKDLLIASLLHDIGKSMIPREILDKNGPLSEEERAVMEQHSRLGFEEIKTQNIRVAYLLVSHHEYQARPYPRDGNKEIGSLSKNETLIRHMGRILAILDHYDSLRSKRAYKEEMPKPKAIEIIKHEFYEEGDQKVITFLEQLDD